MAEDKKQDNSVAKTLENAAVRETLREPARPDSEIYADGVMSFAIRSGVLKIDFYQSVAPTPDGKGEFRRLSHRVALPLAALGELKEYLQQVEAAAVKKV
ncbi:hypothetical protein [Methylotenera sp. G11]|uniref:hypothetical protein n=1 Tax=Methylotenera sp. G11 TaxID=1506585 RepID=UPI001269A431|nr:hypothetical protein [Methylotenera sp. G11]